MRCGKAIPAERIGYYGVSLAKPLVLQVTAKRDLWSWRSSLPNCFAWLRLNLVRFSWKRQNMVGHDPAVIPSRLFTWSYDQEQLLIKWKKVLSGKVAKPKWAVYCWFLILKKPMSLFNSQGNQTNSDIGWCRGTGAKPKMRPIIEKASRISTLGDFGKIQFTSGISVCPVKIRKLLSLP